MLHFNFCWVSVIVQKMAIIFVSYIPPDSRANNVDVWMQWFDVTHGDAALLACHGIDHWGVA